MFSYKFIDIKNTGNHEYKIKIEVQPFVGAYNLIGKDQITFIVSPTNKTQVIQYEHVENYEIPEHLKDRIIKPLP